MFLAAERSCASLRKHRELPQETNGSYFVRTKRTRSPVALRCLAPANERGCWPLLPVSGGGRLPPPPPLPKARAVGASPARRTVLPWDTTSPRETQGPGWGSPGTALPLPRQAASHRSLCAKQEHRFHPFPWDNIRRSNMGLCQKCFLIFKLNFHFLLQSH